MSLKHTYTLIAPFYDLFLDAATAGVRSRSLAALAAQPPSEVLLVGVGTGLDLPHLPFQHRYTGIDLTAAMLGRASARSSARSASAPVRYVRGDAQGLPFADDSFDAAVLHLILAVVPRPELCLAEAARVVRPGGTLLVFDKFLRPGERALSKRVLNVLTRHVATRLDVVFEEVLSHVPMLAVESNEPALAGGWFRLIRLTKRE